MNAASERRFTVTTHDRLCAFCLFLLFSYTLMSLQFQPMPLLKRRLPFDGSDYIFELKMDGFRALAVIEDGRAQLLSRKWASVRFLLRAWKANRGSTAQRKSGH